MIVRRFAALLVMTIGFFGACSTRREASAGSPCVLTDSDMVSGVAPVYRECGVDRKARLTQNAPVDYRPAIVARSPSQADMCYIAEVEFVVDTEGVPERPTIRLIRATDPAYGNAVLGTVSKWRYAPALKEDLPVRQLVRERRTMAVGAAPTVANPGARPNC